MLHPLFALCRLGSGTAALLSQLIASPECPLNVLDLTANRFDEADAVILHRALASNSTLTTLDMRGNTGIASNR